MGRRRTGVNKARDIIRCCQTMDLSEQQIARALDAEQAPSPGSPYPVLEARFAEMVVELKKRKRHDAAVPVGVLHQCLGLCMAALCAQACCCAKRSERSG